ncbi:hypothetical protein G6O69_30830 [Pseudenhygromyxa sp. WMMC2535]|uniref:hypothetical protein n=1 Tax=Pseudenhygromyxa sp. WMMC2535 TaxID=2712867 RepID=UPI0015578982|nr:hypothetical protein [Pseudenhygromyxa sp. WMMC2535]NVB42259.1 hypothetical protein [Pseudenhygromyxa sp. WMMC2535]
MTIHSRLFHVSLAALVGLGLGMGAKLATGASSGRYLCTSIPRACTFAPSEAPVLRANVCWSERSTTLKADAACASGSYPFYVEHGEVDPLTGAVTPYIPLDDACSHGYCFFGPSTGQEDAMCCTSGGCVPYMAGDGECPGELVLCNNSAEGGCSDGQG